ncbi:MAG: hypothetical protein R2813_04235 [Flavobacteriales bacterium]
MKRFLSFLLVLGIVWGCGSGSNHNKNKDYVDSIKRERPLLHTDSARIISLPTPMQIPALLRNTNAHYTKELLTPLMPIDKPFFQSNILFGMYILDLAYASSFSDRQTALLYLKQCRDLSIDLGFGMNADMGLITRFERNLERPDSLGRIILEMYKSGHEYFRYNEREAIGLMMVMGCMYEGMHFSFKEIRNTDLILFFHILAQQKEYVSNLLYALDAYQIPDEVQPEFDILVKTDSLFGKLNAPSAYKLKTGAATLKDVNTKSLNELDSLVTVFRQGMLE